MAANNLADDGAPEGSAGGDLGGTYPDPEVTAVHESGGQKLTLGAVGTGQVLMRSGTSLIGVDPTDGGVGVTFGQVAAALAEADLGVSFNDQQLADVATPTHDADAATKAYVDGEIDAAAADLVPASRTISAGTGLSGGGDLSANRSLAVAYGTSGTTACVGNDSRLSDARTPTSHASSHLPGGDDELTTAAAGAITPGASAGAGSASSFARSDHAHSVPAFGTDSGTFCEGDDSRLSDARTPTGDAGGDLDGTYPNPTVAALHETSGPTKLTLGSVADGTYLKRVGSTLVGATPSGGGGDGVEDLQGAYDGGGALAIDVGEPTNPFVIVAADDASAPVELLKFDRAGTVLSAPRSVETGVEGTFLGVAAGAGKDATSTDDASEGGALSLLSGAGGDASGSGDGGAGGIAALNASDGGDAVTGTPGAGGDAGLQAGDGGDATDGTADGGAGGDAVINAGAGGSSVGGAAGLAGVVSIGESSARAIASGSGSTPWTHAGSFAATTITQDGDAVATEDYVDDAITTAAASLVPSSRTVSAGTGLSGGGDLSANRSLAADFGTTAGKVCEGNDSRVTGALPKAGGTMTGDIAMGTHKVTGLGTPSNDADAATKAYVDGIAVAFDDALSSVEDAALPKAGGTMTGPIIGTPSTTTYASSRTLDVSTNNDFRFTDTWTGNITITLSNGSEGCQGVIWAKQDGSGNRTVSFTVSGRTQIMDAGLGSAFNTADMKAANAVFGIGYYYATIGGTAYVIFSLIPLKAFA
jgi:hypothetical protein